MIGDADKLARDCRDDFLARQRATTALDHRHVLGDFVRTIHIHRQVFHAVQIINRDAQRFEFLCGALGTGHGAIDAMLDFAECRDKKIRSGAGADAHHAAILNVSDGGLCRSLFHFVLVHGRMIAFLPWRMSSKNSDAGSTLVISRWSRARVQAT